MFEPIAQRRIYRQIAEAIEAQIDAGRFPAGSLLPPERDLAQQLSVSRASVREALIALEVQGRVSVKVGNGVTVLTEPSRRQAPPVSEWPEVGPLEVAQARRIVEGETAALAARRASDADIAVLAEHLKSLKQEHRFRGKGHPADRAFHLKIADMSGNQALAQIVANLWQQRASKLFEQFEQRYVTSALYEDASHDHRKILDAIRARDSRAARAAMRAHLDRILKVYSRLM